MIDLARTQRGVLPLTRLAKALNIPRSAFYCDDEDRDSLLRDEIHAIALDWPMYGYRTITAQLKRQGHVVNGKRIRRILKEEGLICRPRKSRGLPYRKHQLQTYPNLAREFVPTRVNQLWVTDFTYVRLFGRFIFVAIVLDAFSRRVVGWSIAVHYRSELTIEALRMAIRRRNPQPGLIHHSDRGGSYCADDYLDVLRGIGSTVSMSRAGMPADNAICERFMRTLKDEEIRIREYVDYDQAFRSIARFLDDTYNHRRLHSSLGYRPPAEFESFHEQQPIAPPA